MEQFGQYRLEQIIGRGGMGEVHRAFDTVRGRVVALKRLPAHLAADEEFQARFRKESALASRLSEPHIIPIHDFGEIDGRLYIDMRLVDGRDLSTVITQDGPLAPERAAAVVAQVASALDAAHADGLVHRDVKPSNVLLTGDEGREFVYLVDFGIARAVGAGADTSLTVTGATVGTLDYMAPERFAGGGSDHRVDVYALSCLLFEALTGRKPFRADGIPAMIHAHLNVEPPLPSRERPSVPAALDAVVATGMAKRPDDRFPSARALADAALAAVRGEPATVVVARPRPPHPALDRPGPPASPIAVARTMVGLPSAGFTPPEDPVEPPAAGGRRRRWPFVAAAVAVAAVGAAVAVVALLRGGAVAPAVAGQETTATVAAPTTEPAATTAPAAQRGPERPPSLPGADPAADQALWDQLQGTGIVWDGCAYTPSATTSRSYLTCDTIGPVLDRRLGFESYASVADVQTEVDGYARVLTGAPGTCDAGATFAGPLNGRDVACGFYPQGDGSSIYFIVWTEPGTTLLATAADRDPATTFQWFSTYDPF